MQHRKPEVCTERMIHGFAIFFHLSFIISATRQYFNFRFDRMFKYEK